MAECATAPGFNQSCCFDDQVQRGRNFILVLLGKSCPSAAGSACGRLRVEDTARGCRQLVALVHAVTCGDMRGTREVVESQWRFGAFPTSHLPAPEPRVPKGLTQLKCTEGNACMVPAGVEHLSTPYDALQTAQLLRSTSAVSSSTVVTESHRFHAPAIRPWFWFP